PYYEARKIAENENTRSGFSHGWVMGLLRWEWPAVANRFGRYGLGPYRSSWDPELGRIRVEAYNKGLLAGFLAGRAAPDELKKTYLHTLSRLAGGVRAGTWSRNEQISYIIAVAAAAVRSGILKFTG